MTWLLLLIIRFVDAKLVCHADFFQHLPQHTNVPCDSAVKNTPLKVRHSMTPECLVALSLSLNTMTDTRPLAAFIVCPYPPGKMANSERVDVSIPFGNENIKVRSSPFRM